MSSLDPAVRSRIETLLGQHPVVLFMKGAPGAPQCGFSAKAVGVLDALLPEGYAHVDVLSDPEIREGIKAYGQWPTIPQLYVRGELVGGSDIVEQMAENGELHTLLGLPAPDRSPPRLTVTPAAAAQLKTAIEGANEGADAPYAVRLDVDARYAAHLQLAPVDPHAIAVETEGLRIQTDWRSARRADGITIEWVDDARGRGLMVHNPNAPPKPRAITPADAADRVRTGALRLIDVRPPEERAMANAPVPFDTFDGGVESLEALPKETPLAFLCHHGARSQQAAEYFIAKGFREVYNVQGGIDAWADADPAVPKY